MFVLYLSNGSGSGNGQGPRKWQVIWMIFNKLDCAIWRHQLSCYMIWFLSLALDSYHIRWYDISLFYISSWLRFIEVENLVSLIVLPYPISVDRMVDVRSNTALPLIVVETLCYTCQAYVNLVNLIFCILHVYMMVIGIIYSYSWFEVILDKCLFISLNFVAPLLNKHTYISVPISLLNSELYIIYFTKL